MNYIESSFYCFKTDITALAASAPFFPRIIACFIFKQVIIPFPTGFLSTAGAQSYDVVEVKENNAPEKGKTTLLEVKNA